MWVRELAWIDPVEAAMRLAGLPHLAFLDSAMPHATLGRYSYVAADPFGLFTVRGGTAYWNGAAEPEAPLVALRHRLARYKVPTKAGLPPFQGGAIGMFAYEFGWSLEGRHSPVGTRGDDVHLAFYDVVIAFDHVERSCRLIANGLSKINADARLDRFEQLLARPGKAAVPSIPTVRWETHVSPDTYGESIERVKTYIRDGDIYQANVAQRFTASLPADADMLELYRAVRTANLAPFAAYLECGARTVLSTSPELFLRCDGRRVETRPIKGTARRDSDPRIDCDVGARLVDSRKDRAENVMIVDLLRNDLAKVCGPESVDVPLLCGLETYAGLHHLVSAVTGDLLPEKDALDLIAATFPGGSITGAPKIRAMEIIAEIEGEPRGVYCGAIGALGFDGSLDLNIAIRTVTIEGRVMELRTGGGITILSDPATEYEETLTKARRIFDAFTPSRPLVEAQA